MQRRTASWMLFKTQDDDNEFKVPKEYIVKHGDMQSPGHGNTWITYAPRIGLDNFVKACRIYPT